MGYGVTMRTKSYRHMTAEERETLSLGLAHGHSLRTMARVLGRAPSTLSRESARNATRGRPYRACTAQTQGGHPSPSAATTAETPGSLAVAVCAVASDRGLLARADCWTPPPRVS